MPEPTPAVLVLGDTRGLLHHGCELVLEGLLQLIQEAGATKVDVVPGLHSIQHQYQNKLIFLKNITSFSSSREVCSSGRRIFTHLQISAYDSFHLCFSLQRIDPF